MFIIKHEEFVRIHYEQILFAIQDINALAVQRGIPIAYGNLRHLTMNCLALALIIALQYIMAEKFT